MAKGGFPRGGMMGGGMMRQQAQMQQKIMKMQKELETKTVEATTGGEAVKVVVNGRKEVVEIELKPEVVDPEDIEMLQDLVMAAINEGLRKADEMVNSQMSTITGGLNLPGGLF